MRYRRNVILSLLSLLIATGSPLHAEETQAQPLIQEVMQAAGGEEKLLKLFRFRERVLIIATPAAPVTADEKGNRTSVVQVSGDWWIGKDKRDKDKVRVLCWAWSLRILLDPKSKVEPIADTVVAGRPAFGLRVSESVKEPIDLLFDRETKLLVAFDYSDTRHIVSEWKKTTEGHSYPSHVTGFRFTNRATGVLSERQWYQTDILELTPLDELPAELKSPN